MTMLPQFIVEVDTSKLCVGVGGGKEDVGEYTGAQWRKWKQRESVREIYKTENWLIYVKYNCNFPPKVTKFKQNPVIFNLESDSSIALSVH